MGENLFAKFNDMIDVAGLQADVEAAKNSDNGEFVDVPHGDYEVKVVKMELAESKKGLPMVKVWFEVLAGEYKGQKIFMNQTIHTGFGVHNLNKFLDSLETGIPAVFLDFEQYNDLLKTIFAEVDGRAEYQLSYGQNNKGFNTFTIEQRY